MRKPNKNKMAGVNSRFASVSESEILKIQEDASILLIHTDLNGVYKDH